MTYAPGPRTGTGREREGLELLFGRRVRIETYGCRYNFGDSEKLAEVLKSHGSVLVDSAEEAYAVVVNTCTVVGPTERRMLRRLARLRDHHLFVTGCMPAVQMAAISGVCSPIVISPDTVSEAYRKVGTVSPGGTGIVQIAKGCLGACTYCITRFARGPLKSIPADEILSQISLHSRTCRAEIQLTSQDVSAWGHDLEKSLPQLLTLIGELDGRFMVRVGMMNPATVIGILDDLVEAFSPEWFFKFIHIPVQSGSDAILERMGRNYTTGDFESIVAAFRKRYPDITLSIDMIVGFPGETEDYFSRSLELIRRIRPNTLNVTRYSARPVTPLYGIKEYLDSIKKERSRLM